jgi:hypothetical protein
MQATAPLNVLGLVGDALRDVFGGLGGLVRIAWPYYALAAAFALLGSMLGAASPATEIMATLAGGGMAQLILSLAVLACVVRWQRHVVLGEPLRGTAPLNRPVLWYSLWSLALGLICLLPVAAAGLIALATGAIAGNETGATPFTISVGGIALLGCGGVLALLLFARLNLVLPAASVADRAFGLAQSWRATRGHTLGLLAVFLTLLLGLGLLGAVAGLVAAAIDTAAGGVAAPEAPAVTPSFVAGAILNTAADLIAAMVGASVTARLYRHLAAAAQPASSAR